MSVVLTRNGRREIHLDDALLPAIGPEPLGLLPHLVHEFRALDPVGKPREILDRRGQRQLTARLLSLEYDGGQIGPGRVKSCRVKPAKPEPITITAR